MISKLIGRLMFDIGAHPVSKQFASQTNSINRIEFSMFKPDLHYKRGFKTHFEFTGKI